MALDKGTLKSDIVNLLDYMLKQENQSIEEFATRLSTAIETYVKSGEVKISVAGVYPGPAIINAVQGTIS